MRPVGTHREKIGSGSGSGSRPDRDRDSRSSPDPDYFFNRDVPIPIPINFGIPDAVPIPIKLNIGYPIGRIRDKIKIRIRTTGVAFRVSAFQTGPYLTPKIVDGYPNNPKSLTDIIVSSVHYAFNVRTYTNIYIYNVFKI